MKKLLLLVTLVTIGFIPIKSVAQVQVSINIGSQPLWGPVGYDYVDYYYLPEIESYYYVPSRQFIYLSNGSWVFSLNLPPRYRGYDLYTGYKVVMNQPRPYMYFNNHKVKYAKYKSNHSQGVIARSNNPKYYVVKGHPKYMKAGNGGKGKGNNLIKKGGGQHKGHGGHGHSK